MAHFAELDSNNIVLRVLCLENSVMENEQGERVEQLGIDFLQSLYGTNTIWAQTSYNTRAGIYYVPGTNEVSPDQSHAFRKNYAGIGYTYDPTRNAFIPPKPYASWVLNEDTCLWESPVPYPDDGKMYYWDEATLSWVTVE
jgi:hypothetical protein